MIVAFIAIAVSFILSGFYREDLFRQGVNFIHNYQTNGNDFTMVIYNLFSLFGHIQIIGPIIGILFLAVYRKFNVLVYLSFYIFNVYLINVTKQAYQNPRPFWVKT